MSGKFALIIANTEYSDPKLAELTAPGKDAEEFARVLKSPDIAAFDKVNTLFNEDVFNVNLAIEDFFALKKPDDLLVLYFSGHGIRDEYGSLFLAVKNTDRARLRATAIRSNYIREAMDYSRSKRQVLILDCCNSGAFAQGTKAEIGGSIGTAPSFEGTGYGRVVLTASDSTQFAWEGDKVIGETVNSLFTHFLVKGLEGEADRDGDGSITVDELYDYAYEQIVSRTPKQTPGKWSYKQQGEIILRQNIRIEDTKPIPLPDELTDAMKSSLLFVREGAVRQLEALLVGRNLGLARSARLALEKIAKEDDSRSISQTAADILERIQKEETLAAEKAAKEKAEREAAEKAAREKAKREATEKAAREKAEQEKQERERLAREEKARKEKEAAEKAAKEKAERERKERERLEREEKARKEKEEKAGELHYEGMLAQKEGKFDKAELLFRQSLEIAIDLKDEQGKANILHQLAILTQNRQAREKAAREKAAQEKAEKEAREKAEREAVEKAEQERQELERLAREEKVRKEKEAAEKDAKEKAERETAEKATSAKVYQQSAKQYAPAVQPSKLLSRTWMAYGVLGLIAVVLCIAVGVWVFSSINPPTAPEEPAMPEEAIGTWRMRAFSSRARSR